MRTICLNHPKTLTTLMLAAMTALLTSCGGSGLPNGATGANGGTPVGVPISIPSPVAGISGVVTDAATGNGVAGVQIRAGGVSNTSGVYAVTPVPAADASVLVNYDMTGYVPQARTTEAYTTPSSIVLLNLPMVPIASTQTFDPTVALTLTVPNSTASIILPANAFLTSAGNPPAAGDVTVRMTPIAGGSNPALMPGNYMGLPAVVGPAAPIETFGAFDLRFTDSANAVLDLAPAVTARLSIPLSTRSSDRPTTIPLFYFDEATNLWQEQGTATLVGSNYEGDVSHFTTWSAARFYQSTVTYTGCVVDAANARVAGATVSAEGISYTSVPSRVTDSTGSFSLPITGSSAIVQATKDIRISNSVTALGTSSTNNPTCLVLAGAVVVRLTWGSSPSDLDSHMLGAGASHVYYSSRGSLTAAPYTALDVDDVTGFGPEVTTVTRLAKSSTYRFFVHNYSGSYAPGQTGSPAKVELIIAGTPRVFTPPSGETTGTAYWHVFDLSTDASCSLRLTAVQQFTGTVPANPNSTGTPSYCQ